MRSLLNSILKPGKCPHCKHSIIWHVSLRESLMCAYDAEGRVRVDPAIRVNCLCSYFIDCIQEED